MDLSIFKGLSINGVSLKELRANGKLIWSALNMVNWAKYSCEIEEETPAHYEEGNFGSFPEIGHYLPDGLSITAYDSYEFSSEDGYVGIGENTYVTPDGLADMVGKYHIEREITTSVDRFIVYEISSYEIAGEDGFAGNYSSDTTCCWHGTKVTECEQVDATFNYFRGSEYYGSIEVADGELPCDAEYIIEEYDDHCIAYIDGTYYYYTKEA